MNGRLIAGWLLAVIIMAGFLMPAISAYFEPYALPALFIMILSSLIPMARLDLAVVFSLEADTWRIVCWQLFVLPMIILAACYLAKFDVSIVTLMAVTACAGSLFASPALVDLLGLNQRKALQCMVLSTFIMPISYFVFMTVILHSAIDMQFADFVGRSGLFLILPAGLFLLYSAFAIDLPDGVVKKIELTARKITIAALITFGLGIIGPASAMLWSNPGRFVLYLAIVTSLGIGMAFLTAIVMYRQGITNALTASIVSGFRNVGLGFVLIGGSAGSDIAAYVGISQIPIFLAPLVMQLFVLGKSEPADRSTGILLPV